MKFQTIVPIDHTRTLAKVKTALIIEFKKPKSESQCITKFKEIKQSPNEIVCDFDQRFKTLMGRLTFQIMLQQHKEWFIVVLLPHIRLPMVQNKLSSPTEALEEAIRLEASPVGESSAWMAQIQS